MIVGATSVSIDNDSAAIAIIVCAAPFRRGFMIFSLVLILIIIIIYKRFLTHVHSIIFATFFIR